MSVLHPAAPHNTLSRRATGIPPMAGFAWFIWQRHRIGLLASIGVLLLEAMLVRLIPALHSGLWLPLLLIPYLGIFLYLVVAFTFADSDLSAVESGYPVHFLRLPVQTVGLALWPMVLGGGVLAGTWLLGNALVAVPLGLQWAYFWPATMLATFFVWLQVVLWQPFSLPYVRPFVVFPLIPVLLVGPAFASSYNIPESMIVGTLLVLAALALPIAVAGVARGRRGDTLERSWSPGKRAGKVRELPAFSHPMQAQFWMEWQRNAPALPTLLGADCLGITIILLLLHDPSMVSYPGGITVEGVLGARVPLMIPVLVPMIGAVVGCGLRKTDTRRQDLSLPVFLATRPLTSAQIVMAKVRAAMLSALVAWGIMLAFGLLWLCLIPATDASGSGSFLVILLRHLTPLGVLQGLVVMVVSLLVTWKSQTDGLFANLTGRAWVATGYYVVVGAGMAGIVAAVLTMMLHPGWIESARAMVPYLLTGAVVAKLTGGLVAVRRLYRDGQVSRELLTRLAAGWLVLAIGLPFLVKSLLPAGTAVPLGYLFAGVILLCLPLARLSLAPLALEANRRR